MHISSPSTTRPSLRRLIITAAVTAIVLIIVGFILDSLGSFEMPVSEALNSLHHGVLGTLGNLLYHWMGPAPAIVLTIVLTAVIAFWKRDLRPASTFAVTIAGTWLSVAVVKLLVGRARPIADLLPLPYHPIQVDASYPSGHATFIAALVFAIIAVVIARQYRTIAVVIGAIVVAFAAFLLTVDGVHYTTDVLGSVVWVIGVAPLVYAVWDRYLLPRLPFLAPRSSRESL